MDAARVSYRLVRSRRRTLTLTVTDAGEVLVKAPLLLPKLVIERFVAEREGWVTQRLAAVSQKPRYDFCDGEQIPYLGGRITLRLSKTQKRVSFADGVLTLPSEPAEQVRARVIAFYKAEARKVFSERMEQYAKEMGLNPKGLRISSANTRWGSCGPDGGISLCYRLVLGDMDDVDYVIVHELSHLVHRDHSKAFWAVVGKTMPDYKARRKALNDKRLELLI